MLARTDHHLLALVTARQDSTRERGQQAGPDDRGLAASRRSYDAQQRRPDKPRDELRNEPLAAEEIPRIVDVEWGESLEGAHDGSFLVVNQGEPRVRPLQLDHPAGQLVLHRAQLGAAGLRSFGYLVDSARGLVPGPLARQLVDALWNAFAALEQPVDGYLVTFGVGGVWSGDLPDRVRVEWAEVERAVGTRGRERLSAFPRRNGEHRHCGDDARKVGELAKHPLAGLIRIVDH